MNSQELAYKKTGNDEAYTPKYGVFPILKYIRKDWTVWCPFDTDDSEFVKMISKTNKVISSHIDDGLDFFECEPTEEWDCIISNPPFKGKRQFFERALSFNKPFALIMTNTWLNDAYSKKVFMEAGRQMQLLMFDKRIKYENLNGTDNNKITFSSSYYCCDFLPSDLICEYLDSDCNDKYYPLNGETGLNCNNLFVLCKTNGLISVFWNGKEWQKNKDNCPSYNYWKANEYARIMGCSFTDID